MASDKLKEALNKALSFKAELATTRRDLTQVQNRLKAITEDQTRLRANLANVPPTSAAYKRYLEKFDTQETDIEKLQASIEDKQDAERVQQAAYDAYLAGLTVE